MKITSEMVKKLRDETGYSMMDCKKALTETNCDFKKAIELMNKKIGSSITNIKSRSTNEGVIETYIHSGNRVGAMLELNCETDFVANTIEFKNLAKNIAMHIVATNPSCISIDELEIIDNTDSILMEQSYIKDTTKTIKELINESIKKFGENIVIKKFIRYEL